MVQTVRANIIFLDLDGTLLDDEKKIPGRNLAALKECQKRGVICGIVTSRRRRKIFELCESFEPDFISYYDGIITEIRTGASYDLLYCRGLSHHTCIGLCEYFRQNMISQNCSCITLDVMDEAGAISSLTPDEYMMKFGDTETGALRIRLYGVLTDHSDELKNAFEEISVTVESNDIIIGSSKYDKGYAVNMLLDHYGLEADEAICFGDSEGDLSMFRNCGFAVAMQNACDPLKDAADYITLPNQCSGVADFIEKHITCPEGQCQKVHSSFPEEECICLLKDLTDQMEPVSFTEKMLYLKSGGKSYDVICHDVIRTKEDLVCIRQLIDANASLVAEKTAILAEKIYESRNGRPVLLSLARGGIPYGVLCRRYLARYHNYNAPHYVISLVRRVGLDENALQYVLSRHEDKDLVFVDGWTGSGYLTDQLEYYVNKFNSEHNTDIASEMAVVADLAEICSLSGTKDDIFLPSACLNAEVSGLLSSICINKEYISGRDFHGCIIMNDMKDSDLSMYYADVVSSAFKRVEPDFRSVSRETALDSNYVVRSAKARLIQQLGLSASAEIRLGIGESFRALFRQPLSCIVINDENDSSVRFLIESAAAKSIEVINADIGKFKAAAVLL